MATATRKCKVCGEEYEYCHTNRRVAGFRWQDVACCPEHGSIYLARILASRSKSSAAQVAELTDDDEDDDTILDEEDEWFKEYYDDDAEEPAVE